MRRTIQDPRPDAAAIVQAEGLAYAHEYWFEGAAYEFGTAQVDRLEEVTAELHDLSMRATRRMASSPEILRRLGIPEYAHRHLRESLERNWSLYGRFDLVWDGESHPKLLEYNADTPAAPVETAVTRWTWLETVTPDRDQWNLLHERLVATWRKHCAPCSLLHLVASDGEPVEDWNTISYLADTAREAGLETRLLSIEKIGIPNHTITLVDDENQPLETCFAMYPWDWMLVEEFGPAALASTVRWLELGSRAAYDAAYAGTPPVEVADHDVTAEVYLGLRDRTSVAFVELRLSDERPVSWASAPGLYVVTDGGDGGFFSGAAGSEPDDPDFNDDIDAFGQGVTPPRSNLCVTRRNDDQPEPTGFLFQTSGDGSFPTYHGRKAKGEVVTVVHDGLQTPWSESGLPGTPPPVAS